jgi:hypothetical protein
MSATAPPRGTINDPTGDSPRASPLSPVVGGQVHDAPRARLATSHDVGAL